VAAGQPVLAQEHIEAEVEVDPALFRPRADYLLRVHGLSMRDAGILDGDWLAVHRSAEARQNAIVVARIEDEVTVKRYQRRGERVRLIAENPDFAPIEIDLRRTPFTLEGLAVGVIRRGL
jgi:repressor LexA